MRNVVELLKHTPRILQDEKTKLQYLEKITTFLLCLQFAKYQIQIMCVGCDTKF